MQLSPQLECPAPCKRLLACYQQALGHDLPNKLVALQGLASLLEQEATGDIGEEARGCLERLVAITRQVHAQVNALADVGRCWRALGSLVPVNLDDLWTEALATVKYHHPGRLEVHADAPLPTLTLPREAARRVVLELLEFSARRASESGPLRVQLSCSQGPASTVVALQDDGPPLSRIESEQAFAPALPPQGDPGSALGLFLAQLLAEGWGGTLELSAPAEGGCLCTLEIPHAPLEAVSGR
jgi:K+-sensing histidine kinase KdpD